MSGWAYRATATCRECGWTEATNDPAVQNELEGRLREHTLAAAHLGVLEAGFFAATPSPESEGPA